MSNIINVKEERNVLSFVGEVFNIVANSTNFYLKFELDNEWKLNNVITVIFNFDGQYVYVELDEDRKCQIPPTNASKIWFCITTEPDEVSKLSSTILSLDVEPSGETDITDIEFYRNTHNNLMGVVQNLLTGNGISAKYAEVAETAKVSQTQVSLTGDEEIDGVKNFTGILKHNSFIVPNCDEIGAPNLIFNANFKINQRGESVYTRNGSDIYTVDRWGLFKGNGTFQVSTCSLTGTDETQPTVFAQWIEDSKLPLLGKDVTASATINGVRYSGTVTLPETYKSDYIVNIAETEDFVFRLYVKRLQLKVSVQFLVNNGVTITLGCVKVEASSYQTKYVERSTAEDLALCQRYFQRLYLYSVGYGATSDKIQFFMNTATPLRNASSVYFVEYPSIIKDGVKTEATNITINKYSNNGVVFLLSGSNFAVNEPYTLVAGILYIDGEYYL